MNCCNIIGITCWYLFMYFEQCSSSSLKLYCIKTVLTTANFTKVIPQNFLMFTCWRDAGGKLSLKAHVYVMFFFVCITHGHQLGSRDEVGEIWSHRYNVGLMRSLVTISKSVVFPLFILTWSSLHDIHLCWIPALVSSLAFLCACDFFWTIRG